MSKVVFTNHVRARCNDYGLSFKSIKENFKNAQKLEIPSYVKSHNHKYYFKSASKIQYRWSKGILYTIRKTNAHLIVITITPKELPDLGQPIALSV